MSNCFLALFFSFSFLDLITNHWRFINPSYDFLKWYVITSVTQFPDRLSSSDCLEMMHWFLVEESLAHSGRTFCKILALTLNYSERLVHQCATKTPH